MVTEDEGDGKKIVKTISESLEASESRTLVVRKDGEGITRVDHTGFEGKRVEARQEDDGTVSYSGDGSPPQGEQRTDEACRTLVHKLNSEGGNWKDPQEGDPDSHSDCLATHASDSDSKLSIQVVQAITRDSFWEEWASLDEYEEVEVDPGDVADELLASIRHKKEHVPEGARSDLVLALNAVRVAGPALQPVVEAFHSQHGDEVRRIGFKQVWLVGMNESLVWRLDVQR